MPLDEDEIRDVVRGMQAYYNERAEQYDDWYRNVGMYANRYAGPEAEAAWHAEVAQIQSWVEGFGQAHVLEIASGTGWWTRCLAGRVQVTALDYAPAMLEVLRRRLAEEHLRADLARGDAYHLPFARHSFDGCFFGFWLSHVPHPLLEPFFAEVARVVRPGGEVLIVDSHPMRGELPGQELKQERILNDGSRHDIVKVYHTPASLAELLAQHGAAVHTWTSGRFFVAGTYRTREA